MLELARINPSPVSYTHLDVYKRQGQSEAYQTYPTGLAASSGDAAGGPR